MAPAPPPSLTVRVPRRARSAFDTAVTAIGIVCTSRCASLCGRHDRFLDDGHAKREGCDDPSRSWHVHGTTRPLESGEFDGNLVVAFRKAQKREVAIGAGVGRAIDGTPDRHANTWTAAHRSDRRPIRTRRLWIARQRTQAHHISARTAAVHRILNAIRSCIYHLVRCLGVTSDGDAPCWRPCLDAVRRRARRSPRPGKSFCCNRSNVALWSMTT